MLHHLVTILSIIAALLSFQKSGVAFFGPTPQATYPRQLLEYENSVCRVKVSTPSGTSAGSGVLLQSPRPGDKLNYILTAYHVISDGGTITVTWDGIQQHAATLVASRPACDVALLTVPNIPPHIPRIPLSLSEIRIGESAYVFGFGDTTSNTLRSTGGLVTSFSANQYNDGVWFDVLGKTRSGDSGGPVFVVRDGTPSLVGIAWGCSFSSSHNRWSVTCSRLLVVHRLFGLEQSPANPAPITPNYNIAQPNPTYPQPVRSFIQAASS